MLTYCILIFHLPETMINTWRNFHRTVTQHLCWFSTENKLKILSLTFQWIKVSIEVYKIICAIYNTIFFNSGGSVDDVLVRLSLVVQIIKDDNLMCISFSVKHSQTFWESWMILPNLYTYLFNQQMVMKTSVESHDKKLKDQRNFYMWTIMGVFQSWVDCLSIRIQAFI